ncbi:MAG TPA: response regulator [Opitutaceae bacterium]
MILRTITVDDEPVALRRISRLLARAGDVEIVAECDSGERAVEAIRQYQPDVVFLDVQMQGMTGFDVLEALKGTRMPIVVFMTAFDEFALQAFEARALDYLLKPFGEARVEQALERVRLYIRGGLAQAEKLEQLTELLAATPRTGRPGCLLVKHDDRVLVLQPSEIDWIESDGDYIRIHTPNEAHYTRMKLTDAERRLTPQGFVRIHRCRLVNFARVKEFRPVSRGTSLVVMKSGARLDASYAYLKQLQGDAPDNETAAGVRRVSSDFNES